jgi:hypothetical protein
MDDKLFENCSMVMLMSEKAEQRHEHHGRSSKDFLDSGKVLKYIGMNESDRFLDLAPAIAGLHEVQMARNLVLLLAVHVLVGRIM